MNKLHIPDMSCGHCSAVITKTVKALDPAASLTFDMPNHTVEVDTSAPLEAVLVALAAEGYPASPAP